MTYIKLLLPFLFVLSNLCALANPLTDLVGRILPQHQKQIVFDIQLQEETSVDFFELETVNRKLHITANSPVSAACGLNWFLKYHCNCSLSFCEDQLNLPAKLPSLHAKVRKETPLTTNFYMNYCTFSYSTAFWDWNRWEREIDLMALNGINTPMAMVGVEVVWRNTLRKFGYTDKEIKEYLCGPAFFAWFLMDNLEGHGGPLPDEWFTQRVTLQKKILKRMRELGMTPVFQSFFGMIPNSLSVKYPDVAIVDQGNWGGEFKRPNVLLSTDPLFKKMAKVWYEEYDKLFGRTTCFGGDLFHEGGNTAGLNISEIAREVQQAMLDYEPESHWFIQCWGGNPRNELLAGLDRNHTIIIDLAAEFWSRWKEREGFNGFPWVWSHVTNYGGNIGLHGRLDAIMNGVIAGQNDVIASKSMTGTSSTPEGIEVNPVVFDLANEMRWHHEPINMYQWIGKYAHRRYGSNDGNIQEAWKIFYETAYGSYDEHRRPSESVFCAQPSLKGKKITASHWSQCKIFYNPLKYANGVNLFLKAADSLMDSPTYRYDVVDFVRQYLSDLGRSYYYQLVDAYNSKDVQNFEMYADRFLEVLMDQDKLLSTHPSFFVGTWIDQARSVSKVSWIKDLYEYNALLQIGTWSVGDTHLRDYAHKEWGGMLRDYYYPRWKSYLTYLGDVLNSAKVEEPDLFAAESAWVKDQNVYSLSPANSIKTAKELFYKYYQEQE